VANRNLTLNLPAELVKTAKIYAAQHDTTVNALVRQLLENAVSGEHRERAAIERFLDIARQVRTKTDPGKIRREELHERW
jgi:plasmid stability protein